MQPWEQERVQPWKERDLLISTICVDPTAGHLALHSALHPTNVAMHQSD